MSQKQSRRQALLLAAACCAGSVFAQQQALPAAAPAPVQVSDAWARVSVAGQTASGAFMRLQAAESLVLVGGRSPAAGLVEVHEMRMDGDVMRMRALPALELPAGKPVELRPGGLHVMLMDLKAPLAAGSTLPLTLVFRDARGAERSLSLQVPVSAQAPGAAGGMRVAPSHGHGTHRH
jgi:periplasmic copper chaperone A